MLHRCTGVPALQGKSDGDRLKWLHERVAPGLLRKELYAAAYTISHTEDLCCEMQRFENRRLNKQGRKRKAGARSIDSQLLRQERLERLGPTMGFKRLPKPPAFFANIGVVEARALLLRRRVDVVKARPR